MNAAEHIDQALRDCLPPGVPTPQTPPTDRPLTAGDVPLLREGDVPRDPDGLETFDSCVDGWVRVTDAKGVRMGFQPKHITFVYRPATSAASEGEGVELPDGAISGTDDGQTVWLESSTGGAHKLGVWGGLSLRFEEANGTHTIRDYVDAALASPPAREEAPDEGAGRPDDYEGPDVGMHDTEIDDRDDDDPELPDTPETRLIYKHFCDVHCLNPDEAADATGALIEDLSALRNRTSEPEAGAVAWRARMRPNGEWMVLDAKYVPSRAAGSAVEVQPLFTNPAPATADKLRVAKLALEKIADEAPYRSRYCQSDVEYGPKLSDIEMQTVARQALAALNEQPQ